jgi:hypothetical protein
MSGATHPQIPIKHQLLRDQRRAKIIALAAVIVLGALLVALILVLDGGNAPTVGQEKPTAQATQQPSQPQVGPYPSAADVPPSLQPGTRYDGGPDEGTAALAQRSAPATFDPNSIKNPPGQRYDGGPEEGTRGIVSAQPPSTRYDGGPEEGSRGSGR